MNYVLNLLGRIGMSAIFIISGIQKITGYAGTQGYMESVGVPGMLLPLVIITEVLGGLMILLGFKTKWAAIALAGFSVLSALLFHLDFSDQMQAISFWKNIAIAGGFLILAASPAGQYSVDGRK